MFYGINISRESKDRTEKSTDDNQHLHNETIPERETSQSRQVLKRRTSIIYNEFSFDINNSYLHIDKADCIHYFKLNLNLKNVYQSTFYPVFHCSLISKLAKSPKPQQGRVKKTTERQLNPHKWKSEQHKLYFIP